MQLFTLWPKQLIAFDIIFGLGEFVPDDEALGLQVLFGGAAGGAKSSLARIASASAAFLWPGSDVAVFRRTDAELEADHIEKWLEDIDPFVVGGRFFTQKKEYHWPSPGWCWCPKPNPCPHSSKTLFKHIDDARGVRKHQGAEHAMQIVDEGGHFKGTDIDYLYTRVRAPESKTQPAQITGPDGKVYEYPGWQNWQRVQLITANPGDIGHQYMLDTYIDPAEGLNRGETEDIKEIIDGPHQLTVDGRTEWAEEVTDLKGEKRDLRVNLDGGQRWTVEADIGPPFGKVRINRVFLPSRVHDNPALDPAEYAASIAIGNKEQVQRLLRGDWSYFEGKVFDYLNADWHFVDGERMLGDLVPPKDWDRALGLDAGVLSAAEWVTRDRDGYYLFYQEHYGVGTTKDHIAAIKDLMMRDGHSELKAIPDPQMFRQNRGFHATYSVADEYMWNGEPGVGERNGIELERRLVERETGRLVLERLLQPQEDLPFPEWHPLAGQLGSPRLFISRRCPNLWRELNGIQRKADSDDTVKVDDHAYDAAWHVLPVFERAMEVHSRSPRREVIAASSPRTVRRSNRGRQVVERRR